VTAVDSTKQLAWEARQRPRAGIAALIAAVLTLGPDLWTNALFQDAPKAAFLDGLLKAIQPGPVGATESLRTPYFVYYDQHAASFVAANVAKGIGFVGLAWALTFLVAAARARRPEMSRLLVYVPLVGAVLSGIAAILASIAFSAEVSDFLSGPHTVERAETAGGTVLITAQFLGFIGQLLLAAGYVLLSLNAMRTGLITRFLGILGCIVGVLVVVGPTLLPVMQSFWLLALGVLLLGRWPSGMPPAWRTGKAEPWPSQSEVAGRRRAAAEARRAARKGTPPARTAPADPAADAADSQANGADPAGARRKRKRRS
jgi:hypothetical protein